MSQRDDPAPDVPPRENAATPGETALAALKNAIAREPKLPPPPAGLEDPQFGGLSRAWRLLPQEPEKEIDLGKGWRGWLRSIGWRLLRPILQRQQHFNTLIVHHVDQSRESAARLVVFQSHLVDFLRHLDQSGESLTAGLRETTAGWREATDDLREHMTAGLRETTAGWREATDGLRESADAQRESADAQRRATEDLRQTVDLAAASAHGLKREVERLRRRFPPTSGAADRARQVAAAEPGTPAAAATGDSASEPAATEPAAADAGRDDASGLSGDVDDDASRPPPPFEADLDSYQYVCFEDVFRGAPEEIAAGQRDYLPYFEGASDVLDVGCGRGEFLALLREQGITARGVDANAEAIERCRERGLEAARADALAYLRALPDEAIGGLFSAQVVEHLEADYLMQMLGSAQRVLRPGSRIVLETINPASWTAFFSAYVRDITHRHPLHPETLAYLLRASGFVDVTIVYRAPVPDEAKLQRAAVDPELAATRAGKAVCLLADTLNQHAELLNGLVFAEQDYAAVGRRP